MLLQRLPRRNYYPLPSQEAVPEPLFRGTLEPAGKILLYLILRWMESRIVLEARGIDESVVAEQTREGGIVPSGQLTVLWSSVGLGGRIRFPQLRLFLHWCRNNKHYRITHWQLFSSQGSPRLLTMPTTQHQSASFE